MFRRLAIIWLMLIPSLVWAASVEEEIQGRLDRGLSENPALSYVLAEKAAGAAKTERAALLNEAVRLSPDSPGLYFMLAGNELPNLLQSIDYAVGGVKAYGRSFWWKTSIEGILSGGLLLSLFLSLAVVALIRLPIELPLLMRDVNDDKKNILPVVALIPLSALGPVFFVVWALCLIGLYANKAGKAVVFAALILVLASPLYLKALNALISASSPQMRAIVAVNEGKDNRFAIEALKEGGEFESAFSHGLALKREGRYQEAIYAYGELLKKTQDRRVSNNLGNAYTAAGNFDAAKESYKKAIESGGNPPAIAPLYNLSQVYRDTLDFKTGDGYFAEAQKADPAVVSRFMAIASRNPNRFVMDEVLNKEDFRKFAWRNAKEAVNPFTVSPMAASLAGLFAVVYFIAINAKAGRRAVRCSKCFTIVSGMRRGQWGNMCGDCYRSLSRIKDLDAKDRVARLLTVTGKENSRRRILRVLSFAPPGVAQIYSGHLMSGFLYLWLFLLPAAALYIAPFFSTGLGGHSHIWLKPLALSIMALVYLVSVITANWRLRWL